VKLLLLLLRNSRLAVLLAVVCGLIAGASNAGLLALTSSALTGAGAGLGGYFAGLCAIALLARFASTAVLNWMQHGVIFELRAEFGRRILATPLRRLEEVGQHRLLATLTGDVMSVSIGLMLLPQLLINVALLLGCLGYMAWLSWPILLTTAGIMAVGLVTYVFSATRSLKLLRSARETYDLLLRHFRTLMDGVKELKMHRWRRESFLRDDLNGTATLLRSLDVRSGGIDAANSSWGMLLFFVIIGLLLFVVPGHFPSVNAATLTGFTLTILYMQQPLDNVLNSFHTVGQAAIALHKLETLGLDERSPELLGAPPASFERLELRGLTHTYHREKEDGRFILGPIHLEIRPGQLVFLVGGNGSGKTTLAKMLTGLYTPESGDILVDGVPITGDEAWERYRQLFSVVFVDFCLFERLQGLEREDLVEQATRYLERLQLSHKVTFKDGALSTTALSQGQRKRLALLTAYLEDRPFYVFDEWAADQDPVFKVLFYEQLLPDLKRQGKAVLVITHDDRYFHLADRLLMLEDGQFRPETPTALPGSEPTLRPHGT